MVLVSDEIHQDLTLNGHEFTPFLTVAEGYEHMVVSLTSMTKTFNVACPQALLSKGLDRVKQALVG